MVTSVVADPEHILSVETSSGEFPTAATMTTPGASAMKHALSQQGKTPSQSQQGAAATPPVAFSPHGPRSSPQQVKKSPATVGATVISHGSNAAINFDSPSAAAAFNALQMGGGLDLGLQGLDGLDALGRSTEDERAKRLDAVIARLSVCLLRRPFPETC